MLLEALQITHLVEYVVVAIDQQHELRSA